MQFCQIIPSNYLPAVASWSPQADLLLAHLIDVDGTYTDWYTTHRAQTRILDNSMFELYRLGLPAFDGNKMIDIGRRVNANYLVLPDYPGESSAKTIAAANEFGPKFHDAGFGTFFVPQGLIGNVQDYIDAFHFAATSEHVDYIGVSIIAGPNAYNADSQNNIQTFLSRLHLCMQLDSLGLIGLAKANSKKIHFLGMTDGPREIEWAARILPGVIDTWDSSSATWAGINDVLYDNSPTGLVNGKIHSHVDFSIAFDESKLSYIRANIKEIDSFVDYYNIMSKQ